MHADAQEALYEENEVKEGKGRKEKERLDRNAPLTTGVVILT
jgi:hypothetical protein